MWKGDPTTVLESAIVEAQSQQRECGSCKVCCKVMGIPEMESEPGSWCPKTVAKKADNCGGCTIHEKRPITCREFVCVWASGRADNVFRDDDETEITGDERPDKYGAMVFSFTNNEGDPVIGVAETKPNGLNRPHIQRLIDRVSAAGFEILYLDTEMEPTLLEGSGKWKEHASAPEVDVLDIVNGGIWIPRRR
jgi:hypothetical protein